MQKIKFLGSGGGRFVMVSQKRYTGGLLLDLGVKIAVDPGPGALIRAIEFGEDPSGLDAVFVSHKHLDHYGDAEALIEAMTYGAKVAGGKLVIDKNARGYISEYHQGVVEVLTPEPGDVFRIGPVEVKALLTHNHAGGLGFRFKTEEQDIVYTSDTGYSEDLLEQYMGSKTLILNVIFPRDKGIKTHLNTESAKKIIDAVRPELAVISHFGRSMLNAGPEREAAYIEKETGIRTIPAEDGLEIDLSRGPPARGGQEKLTGF